MDRFQVTPSLAEFFIDSGKTATLTNIGTATIYGAPDAMFPNVGAAAWSLAPGAMRVEDYGTLWVRTADGVSSTLTVDPIATGTATDIGTGQGSALGSGGSGAPTGAAGGDLGGTYPNPTVPGLASKAKALPTPPFTAIAGAAQKTPPQLTMRVVHAERSRFVFPTSGPHCVFREEFENADQLSGRYTVYTASGLAAPSSEGIANGKLTMTAGASLAGRIYRGQTQLLTGCGVFVAARVEPGATGATTQAMVGFAQDSVAGGNFFAWYEPVDGKVGVFSGNGSLGFGVGSPSSPATVAAMTAPTQAVYIGLLLHYPTITALWSLDGENWQIAAGGTVTGLNFYTESVWKSFRPMVQLRAEASQTISVSKLWSGYAGELGVRDWKPVRYADGTPLRKNGKYWFTGTVAAGPSFRANHMAVFSLDPDTYQVELIRHLFFNLAGTGIGAGFGGQMVYDEVATTWHVLANSWGFDDQATGVDLIYGTTAKDLLSPGSSLITASRLTGLSTFSLYDSTLYRDGAGVWHVAAVETTARTSWASTQGVTIFSGTSLTALSRVAADTTHTGYDGTNYTKIGGTWYIVAGGPSGFSQWNTDLSGFAAIPSWSSDAKVAAILPFSTYPAHPGVVEVDDESRTRYVVLSYDASYVAGLSATRGGLVVLEADEKPAGQEFASKANTYFGY